VHARKRTVICRNRHNSTTDYNPEKPWGYLWKISVCTDDCQETRWWYREFERKIPMLLEQGVGNFIEGDARVSATLGGHFASTHNVVNVGDKSRSDITYGTGGGGGASKKSRGDRRGGDPRPASERTPPPQQHSSPRPGQPHTKCKKGVLCTGTNSGTCAGNAGGACPNDPAKRHLCHWCLGQHPGNKCDPAKTKQRQSGGKGGKRGGKGGKGGKEK
jgi:hypothetical protein